MLRSCRREQMTLHWPLRCRGRTNPSQHIVTSSMEAFSVFLALCEGNPPVTGGFPSQRPVTRSFDVFYELRMITRLSKQSRRRWFKDRAHLSTFKIFIFEKFSCFIVLVVFLVIVQSPELVSVWFCEKKDIFPNFFSYHIFAIYEGGASLGLPTACRLIAVSGARLPSVDGLVVRCIKMHHHVKSAITICLQLI